LTSFSEALVGTIGRSMACIPSSATLWSPVPAKTCLSPVAVSSVFSEFHDPATSPATPVAVAADELGELDFDDGKPVILTGLPFQTLFRRFKFEN
jgi:hypothetical protein